MSSYVLKKIRCKCCGNEFEGKLLKGFYNSDLGDLDGFPHNPAVFDRVVVCPACGYATDRIQAEVDDFIANVVHSDKYQKIFSSEQPDVIKKELLNAMLKKEKGLYREAAFSYLRIYWNQRGTRQYDEKALTEAVQCFSKYLEKNMDIDAAIVLIDCQRQHADFAEAGETASSLLPYVEGTEYEKLVEFELQLISEQDMSPHSKSEVYP